jgi:putative zinc finger protein
MSRPSTSAHDWAVRQLVAYSAGLLPEDELLRLEEHLQACPDCRSRLAPLKPAAGTSSGHLPASLIATWSRSSRLLEGLERELVESHLEECEECRATLRFAGHEPSLAAEPAPARPAAPAPARWWTRHAGFWALGLSGAAAGLLAWAIATAPPGPDRDWRNWGVMGARGRAVSITFEFALDSLSAGAVKLPEPGFRARGVVTNVSGMVFVLPPALQPPTPEAGERRMVITLLKDGRELASRTSPFYALGDAIRLCPDGRLEAGDYDLRFALDPAGAPGEAGSGEPPLVWFYRLRVR